MFAEMCRNKTLQKLKLGDNRPRYEREGNYAYYDYPSLKEIFQHVRASLRHSRDATRVLTFY